MASVIFKPGNRLFAAGSIGIVLVALLHTLGHFAPPPKDDAALEGVMAAMRNYQFDLGLNMKPNMMDIFESLSLTMSVTVIFLGVQNLAALASAGDNLKLVRRLNWLSLIGIGALVVLYAVYRVLPPLFSFAVVEIILIFALLLPHKQRRGGKALS
jgi:hypothetical protein